VKIQKPVLSSESPLVSRKHREDRQGNQSFVLWFTGLSGSGKSTLARAVEQSLFENNLRSFILDGDNIRQGLNGDLGFSNEDRLENIRRISEVSRLFINAGVVVLVAFITPLNQYRTLARSIIGDEDYVEIYVSSSLKDCEVRDPKGLYARARRGEIQNFTGIDAPFEEPVSPSLTIDTQLHNLEESVEEILSFLKRRGKFKS